MHPGRPKPYQASRHRHTRGQAPIPAWTVKLSGTKMEQFVTRIWNHITHLESQLAHGGPQSEAQITSVAMRKCCYQAIAIRARHHHRVLASEKSLNLLLRRRFRILRSRTDSGHAVCLPLPKSKCLHLDNKPLALQSRNPTQISGIMTISSLSSSRNCSSMAIESCVHISLGYLWAWTVRISPPSAP